MLTGCFLLRVYPGGYCAAAAVVVVVVVVVVRRGLFLALTVVCFGYLFRRCWQSLFIISSPTFSFSLAFLFLPGRGCCPLSRKMVS